MPSYSLVLLASGIPKGQLNLPAIDLDIGDVVLKDGGNVDLVVVSDQFARLFHCGSSSSSNNNNNNGFSPIASPPPVTGSVVLLKAQARTYLGEHALAEDDETVKDVSDRYREGRDTA